MKPASRLLEIENLRVGFPAEGGFAEAVSGITFSIGTGEAVGLVGESGSGKTLTALAVMGLVATPGRVLGGQIQLNGTNLLELSEDRLRKVRGKEISMIFQDPLTSLNPAISIGRQLTDVIQTHQHASRREALEFAIETLALVGIPSPAVRMKSFPHEFSGGMRQRVLVAMAVACRPKLLIADEPTTALDVTVQAQVIELIRRLRDELGLSILFITHNLNLMAELCERTVVLYAGRVMEEGSVHLLFRHPLHPYTRLLLECVPQIGVRQSALRVIEGLPPALGEQGQGCPFAPRCPQAHELCRTTKPPEFLIKQRRVACWLVESEVAASV